MSEYTYIEKKSHFVSFGLFACGIFQGCLLKPDIFRCYKDNLSWPKTVCAHWMPGTGHTGPEPKHKLMVVYLLSSPICGFMYVPNRTDQRFLLPLLDQANNSPPQIQAKYHIQTYSLTGQASDAKLCSGLCSGNCLRFHSGDHG